MENYARKLFTRVRKYSVGNADANNPDIRTNLAGTHISLQALANELQRSGSHSLLDLMIEDLVDWLNELLQLDAPITKQNFFESLKSGVILCRLANCIEEFAERKSHSQSSSEPAIAAAATASNFRPKSQLIQYDQPQDDAAAFNVYHFVPQTNLFKFFNWCAAHNVPRTALFSANELAEHSNKVVTCLMAISQHFQPMCDIPTPMLIQIEQIPQQQVDYIVREYREDMDISDFLAKLQLNMPSWEKYKDLSSCYSTVVHQPLVGSLTTTTTTTTEKNTKNIVVAGSKNQHSNSSQRQQPPYSKSNSEGKHLSSNDPYHSCVQVEWSSEKKSTPGLVATELRTHATKHSSQLQISKRTVGSNENLNIDSKKSPEYLHLVTEQQPPSERFLSGNDSVESEQSMDYKKQNDATIENLGASTYPPKSKRILLSKDREIRSTEEFRSTSEQSSSVFDANLILASGYRSIPQNAEKAKLESDQLVHSFSTNSSAASHSKDNQCGSHQSSEAQLEESKTMVVQSKEETKSVQKQTFEQEFKHQKQLTDFTATTKQHQQTSSSSRVQSTTHSTISSKHVSSQTVKSSTVRTVQHSSKTLTTASNVGHFVDDEIAERNIKHSSKYEAISSREEGKGTTEGQPTKHVSTNELAKHRSIMNNREQCSHMLSSMPASSYHTIDQSIESQLTQSNYDASDLPSDATKIRRELLLCHACVLKILSSNLKGLLDDGASSHDEEKQEFQIDDRLSNTNSNVDTDGLGQSAVKNVEGAELAGNAHAMIENFQKQREAKSTKIDEISKDDIVESSNLAQRDFSKVHSSCSISTEHDKRVSYELKKKYYEDIVESLCTSAFESQEISSVPTITRKFEPNEDHRFEHETKLSSLTTTTADANVKENHDANKALHAETTYFLGENKPLKQDNKQQSTSKRLFGIATDKHDGDENSKSTQEQTGTVTNHESLRCESIESGNIGKNYSHGVLAPNDFNVCDTASISCNSSVERDQQSTRGSTLKEDSFGAQKVKDVANSVEQNVSSATLDFEEVCYIENSESVGSTQHYEHGFDASFAGVSQGPLENQDKSIASVFEKQTADGKISDCKTTEIYKYSSGNIPPNESTTQFTSFHSLQKKEDQSTTKNDPSYFLTIDSNVTTSHLGSCDVNDVAAANRKSANFTNENSNPNQMNEGLSAAASLDENFGGEGVTHVDNENISSYTFDATTSSEPYSMGSRMGFTEEETTRGDIYGRKFRDNKKCYIESCDGNCDNKCNVLGNCKLSVESTQLLEPIINELMSLQDMSILDKIMSDEEIAVVDPAPVSSGSVSEFVPNSSDKGVTLKKEDNKKVSRGSDGNLEAPENYVKPLHADGSERVGVSSHEKLQQQKGWSQSFNEVTDIRSGMKVEDHMRLETNEIRENHTTTKTTSHFPDPADSTRPDEGVSCRIKLTDGNKTSNFSPLSPCQSSEAKRQLADDKTRLGSDINADGHSLLTSADRSTKLESSSTAELCTNQGTWVGYSCVDSAYEVERVSCVETQTDFSGETQSPSQKLEAMDVIDAQKITSNEKESSTNTGVKREPADQDELALVGREQENEGDKKKAEIEGYPEHMIKSGPSTEHQSKNDYGDDESRRRFAERLQRYVKREFGGYKTSCYSLDGREISEKFSPNTPKPCETSPENDQPDDFVMLAESKPEGLSLSEGINKKRKILEKVFGGDKQQIEKYTPAVPDVSTLDKMEKMLDTGPGDLNLQDILNLTNEIDAPKPTQPSHPISITSEEHDVVEQDSSKSEKTKLEEFYQYEDDVFEPEDGDPNKKRSHKFKPMQDHDFIDESRVMLKADFHNDKKKEKLYYPYQNVIMVESRDPNEPSSNSDFELDQTVEQIEVVKVEPIDLKKLVTKVITNIKNEYQAYPIIEETQLEYSTTQSDTSFNEKLTNSESCSVELKPIQQQFKEVLIEGEALAVVKADKHDTLDIGHFDKATRTRQNPGSEDTRTQICGLVDEPVSDSGSSLVIVDKCASVNVSGSNEDDVLLEKNSSPLKKDVPEQLEATTATTVGAKPVLSGNESPLQQPSSSKRDLTEEEQDESSIRSLVDELADVVSMHRSGGMLENAELSQTDSSNLAEDVTHRIENVVRRHSGDKKFNEKLAEVLSSKSGCLDEEGIRMLTYFFNKILSTKGHSFSLHWPPSSPESSLTGYSDEDNQHKLSSMVTSTPVKKTQESELSTSAIEKCTRRLEFEETSPALENQNQELFADSGERHQHSKTTKVSDTTPRSDHANETVTGTTCTTANETPSPNKSDGAFSHSQSDAKMATNDDARPFYCEIYVNSNACDQVDVKTLGSWWSQEETQEAKATQRLSLNDDADDERNELHKHRSDVSSIVSGNAANSKTLSFYSINYVNRSIHSLTRYDHTSQNDQIMLNPYFDNTDLYFTNSHMYSPQSGGEEGRRRVAFNEGPPFLLIERRDDDADDATIDMDNQGETTSEYTVRTLPNYDAACSSVHTLSYLSNLLHCFNVRYQDLPKVAVKPTTGLDEVSYLQLSQEPVNVTSGQSEPTTYGDLVSSILSSSRQHADGEDTNLFSTLHFEPTNIDHETSSPSSDHHLHHSNLRSSNRTNAGRAKKEFSRQSELRAKEARKQYLKTVHAKVNSRRNNTSSLDWDTSGNESRNVHLQSPVPVSRLKQRAAANFPNTKPHSKHLAHSDSRRRLNLRSGKLLDKPYTKLSFDERFSRLTHVKVNKGTTTKERHLQKCCNRRSKHTHTPLCFVETVVKFGKRSIFIRHIGNTVMVRIGGGWQPLEQYLEKQRKFRATDELETKIRSIMDAGKFKQTE